MINYAVPTFEYIYIYIFSKIRTGILDFLRKGFPWPARTFKLAESNSFQHAVTTFQDTNLKFILPPGPPRLARPPHNYLM